MSKTRRKPGPLGRFVDGYCARLLELGYAPPSVRDSLTALEHPGRWLQREELDPGQLSNDVVETFLADHGRDHGHLPSAALLPLLEYLRSDWRPPRRSPRVLDNACSDATDRGALGRLPAGRARDDVADDRFAPVMTLATRHPSAAPAPHERLAAQATTPDELAAWPVSRTRSSLPGVTARVQRSCSRPKAAVFDGSAPLRPDPLASSVRAGT